MINRGFIEEADCPALNYQRLTKPLIEKRRRARINGCLGELKTMVIDSGKQPIQNPKCKYEKADILEITVDYLKNMHSKQELDNTNTKEAFSAGFQECIKQVEHFMKCIPLSERLSSNNANSYNNILDHNLLSQKLLTHLDFCRHELTDTDNSENSAERPVLQTTTLELDNQHLHHMNTSGYFDRNLMSPNSFSVIHHTRDYSSSISSTSSASSTKTMFSPPSSPEPRHRYSLDSGVSLSSSRSLPQDYMPGIRDIRANSIGLYENERNGQCYQLDADGVWRPW